MKRKQHELKKQLWRLKAIKLQVLEGERNDYTEEQLNQAIDKIREQLGVKEDREVVIAMENVKDNLDLTYGYEVFLEDSKTMTIHEISVARAIHKNSLIKWVEKKKQGEIEMGKITAEKFKEAVAAGKALSDIAKEYDVKEATLRVYKNQWKKQGLIGAEKAVQKKESAEVKAVVQDEQLQRDYAALNDLYKSLQVETDKEINELKERNEELQNIAHYNEAYTNELQDQVHMLSIELENANEENERLRKEINETLLTIENDKKNDINREMHLLLLEEYTQRLKA